ARWMMYWVCFGIFSACEVFSDLLLGFWFPFYYELKILFILWLVSSYGNGARIMYKHIIHPEFEKREEVIDTYIATAKEIGVSSAMQFIRKVTAVFNKAMNHVLNLVSYFSL
ncbi:receptor expression-enhancing protein 1-like protein, partial [Dinothrombium tinctorium]